MEPLAYLNSSFVPASELKVSIHDAGFLWGATLTDRVRTYHRKLFGWEKHLHRFRNSCRWAHIELRHTDDELTEIAEHLLQVNHPNAEASVVLVATPGIKSLPIPTVAESDRPTLMIHTVELNLPAIEQMVKKGIRLAPVVAPLGVEPKIKHRSRLNWWRAYHATFPQEPLLVSPTTEEWVLETWNGNILMFQDNTLVTPPLEWILNGISLQQVLDYARTQNLRIEERPISFGELQEAKEVFVTCTTYGIAWVSELGERKFPPPHPDSLFPLLQKAFPY